MPSRWFPFCYFPAKFWPNRGIKPPYLHHTLDQTYNHFPYTWNITLTVHWRLLSKGIIVPIIAYWWWNWPSDALMETNYPQFVPTDHIYIWAAVSFVILNASLTFAIVLHLLNFLTHLRNRHVVINITCSYKFLTHPRCTITHNVVNGWVELSFYLACLGWVNGFQYQTRMMMM